MLGRTDRRWRSVAILILMCAFAFVAVLRLAYWQVAMASWLQVQAAPQLARTTTQPAVRGDIFDRNGHLLATTGYRDTLTASPDLLSSDGQERKKTVAGLTTILDLDEAARSAIDTKLASHGKWAMLRRGLTADQSAQIRAGLAAKRLYGLLLEPQLVRIYPNPGGQPGTTLASQLLGFVSASDGDSIGHYGIEAMYDRILAGGGRSTASAAGGSGLLLDGAQVGGSGADGQNITISIDASLQLQLEKELYAAWVADKAKRVSGLVMDPTTGEILAWASVPGYDANDGGNVAARDPGLVQDPIVTQAYEPGSVMKMLTATSALKNKVVTPNTRILDSAILRFGSQSVQDSDHLGKGRIPVKDVIAYSRNVAVSRIAARLGSSTARAATTLYKTWREMGIGVRTGVDVWGEVAGIADDPRHRPWAPIDLANRAFGQGVTVTSIQLATAYTPMINGGTHVQPHFLVAVGGARQAVTPGSRVLSKRLAGQLQGILNHVTSAVWWYAQGSLIPHYQVGGKTGTAQIWRPDLWNPVLKRRGAWDPHYFNFTFVGYVGGDAPAAVVAVHIDEAKSLTKGQGDFKLNITSYQLFRRVAMAVIGTQNVHRSSDPRAGHTEAGSEAERVLEPLRYYRRTHRTGHSR